MLQLETANCMTQLMIGTLKNNFILIIVAYLDISSHKPLVKFDITNTLLPIAQTIVIPQNRVVFHEKPLNGK